MTLTVNLTEEDIREALAYYLVTKQGVSCAAKHVSFTAEKNDHTGATRISAHVVNAEIFK